MAGCPTPGSRSAAARGAGWPASSASCAGWASPRRWRPGSACRSRSVGAGSRSCRRAWRWWRRWRPAVGRPATAISSWRATRPRSRRPGCRAGRTPVSSPGCCGRSGRSTSRRCGRWSRRSPPRTRRCGADLGVGPISPRHPELTCRRLLVRSTGARHRAGYTAILTNLPETELAAVDLEPFYEARQTIEGWLAEATAALQLKGLWSRTFAGLEAFLLHAALASNLLNWWARRELLPGSGLPHLGLRQLIGRVITLPARVLRTADGHLALLLPPTHPYARRLVPTGPAWQLPLPFTEHQP